MNEPTHPDLTIFRAHLFDLDGVVTPTALVHMKAWSRMFTDFLTSRGVTEPYTDDDYFDYVDGKPRYEGVASFLESRDIELPDGDPSDPEDQAEGSETVCGLGNRKNTEVLSMIRTSGVEPYPGTIAYLDSLPADARLAIVSSSRNAEEVLKGAGLRDRFEHVVDGNVASQQGLPGKPSPDTFLHAAKLLDADAAQSVVYEDAVAGVRAGAAGRFGAVIGVDRGVGHETLRDAGASFVVDDLEELA